MSYEFIEVDFPCKTCLTQAMCAYVERLEKKVKRPKVLAVPEHDEKDTYHKVLLECWVNLGNAIHRNTTVIVASNNTVLKHEVPSKHFMLIRQMAELMEYIIHSASWRTGEIQEFDSIEINRRLKQMRG